VQLAWLGLLLAALAMLGPPATAGSASAYIVTFCAGAGMGAQGVLSRLAGRLGQATSVMTSNFTQFVMAACDALRGRSGTTEDSRKLGLLGTLLLSFTAGATAGGIAEARFGLAVIGLPLLGLAGLLIWLSRPDRSTDRAGEVPG
jgi:uncharacterized membrane protein YoaK (UPF0700 family)